MIPISAKVSASGVFKRLTDFPNVLDAYLIPALDRWEIETTREAKAAASQFDSTGVNRAGIHGEKPDKYTRIVATGTHYGRYLEEGIRGNQPRMPNVSALFPWMRQKMPGATVQEVDRRTYMLGRHIQKHGTKAHPYMAPTAEKMVPRGGQLLGDAVLDAIAELNASA